ncbi:MAG: cupin domain-containing protein [Pannonibacter sp.]
MQHFLPFDLDRLTPEADAPAPEKIVSGSPQFTTWLVETRDDERQFTGVWQSTPGAWRVSYDEWEFCSILNGHSRLTDASGSVRDLKAGDSFIIEPGFSGIWEVVETTRKLFVIRLPD